MAVGIPHPTLVGNAADTGNAPGTPWQATGRAMPAGDHHRPHSETVPFLQSPYHIERRTIWGTSLFPFPGSWTNLDSRAAMVAGLGRNETQ